MLEAKDVKKTFGSAVAIRNSCFAVEPGNITGLVGSNGAGKSTLLRLLAGVYKPSAGAVLLNGEPLYDQPAYKAQVAFVADTPYFLPQASALRMAQLYAAAYPGFSMARFLELAQKFEWNMKAPLSTFSKGMRRQAEVALALSCGAQYILLDEVFDGLDPVMRERVRRLLYEEMERSNAAILLSSHSLRELSDVCDRVALLHKGELVLQGDSQSLQQTACKVQVAFAGDFGEEVFAGLELLSFTKQGYVAVGLVRGSREEAEAALRIKSPLLLEILPLTLEELFLQELAARGYSADVAQLEGEVG